MSGACTGSLLTQQTVLGFSSHPPSPCGASRLPQCVTEQRGGQRSFAMNRHTQLQFNLGIPPQPANMATHFHPSHPSPVVIEKPVFAGGEQFKTLSAKKLALAVRLARRDLKLGQCRQPAAEYLCHSCRKEQETPLRPTVDWNSTQPLEAPCVEVPQASPYNGSCTDLEWERDNLERPLPHRTTQYHPPNHKKPQLCRDDEILVSEASVDGNRREGGRGSQEVIRLRRELHKQVLYMKQLRELGRGHSVLAKTQRGAIHEKVKGRGGEGGRVWMEEVKDEEDKLLQRREEQAMRDARTIYNLSQQVSSLQKDMQKLQLTATPANAKKDQATRRLAAIYRSALRLLQKYQGPGHTSQPLPPELSLLLQQLSLLSRHFGVGGANSELDTTVKVLQELAVEKENVLASRQSESVREDKAPLRPTRQKTGKRVRPAKKTSVLLHPQLRSRSVRSRRERTGQPHFAQQTMSSQRRQQPRKTVHSPVKHSPAILHSSTPLGLVGEGGGKTEPSMRRDHRGTSLGQDTTSPSHSRDRDRGVLKAAIASSPNSLASDKSVAATGLSSLRGDGGIGMAKPGGERVHIARPYRPEEEEREGTASPPNEQRMWMESISATLSHHSKQLEAFKKSTQKQLSQLNDQVSSKRSDKLASPCEQTREESEEEAEPLVDRTKLERLAERLRELEGEEELIRERWQTIAYEDPLLAKRQVIVEKGVETVNSPPPTLSTEAQQRISTYQQRFQHHLQMTGHSTKGGFNPWKMAESLADQLLSEVVDQVADEIGHLCDECVDGIFSSEFAPPTCSEETKN